MSTTTTYTMSGLLDLSVDKLPFFRRNLYKLLMKNPANRQLMLASLVGKLHDDEEVQAMGFSLVIQGFGSYNDPFSLNPDNLAKILELIMKYLPQILELIMSLMKAVALIALTMSLSQSAHAQCFGGNCQIASRIANRVEMAPLQQSAAYYPAVSSSPVSYGSSGAAAVASYGSAGGSNYASVGSASERGPILFPRIRNNIRARASATGYGSSGTPSAAGYGSSGTPLAAPSYGSSGTPMMLVPVSAPVCAPVVPQSDPAVPQCGNANCTCVNCACPQAAPVVMFVQPPTQMVATQAPVMSGAYAVALASATYRAANRIKGHCFHERGRTAGVGWSTSNSQPATCFGRSGAYVSVRGSDGWYSTSIIQ